LQVRAKAGDQSHDAAASEHRAKSLGRPRSEATDAAILDAASALLEECGYSSMTVDEVAARAGVGKQTLYRRWPSKAAVVLDALSRQAAREVAVPDSGSLHEDVRALLRNAFAVLRMGRARVVASLMAEAQHDEAFAVAFRDIFVAPRRAVLAELLHRGIVRGELGADTDVGFMVDLVYGPMWYRLLNRHAPLDDAFADRLSDAVLAASPSIERRRKQPPRPRRERL
jgi:AcrR family transcriptional regulator